jgi:UDPglucose--hexose-1-phosphate uridylyltransferase
VIAPGRAKRPGAKRGALEQPTAEELDSCPFCEGREDRTPPEVLALPQREPPDSPGWRVRVVPNLYPAFERQEVVVHVSRHARSLADLSDPELGQVAQAWRERRRAVPSGYLHAIVNEGRDAGASLPHSHSQLVWLREAPPAVVDERDAGCGVCEALSSSPLVVSERDGVVLLAAFGARAPYELHVAPRAHGGDAFASASLQTGLALLAEGIRRLRALEGPVPWNAWLHDSAHWHIELVPRLTVFAGVELGAGIYVNTVAPEQAAEELREAGAG